MTIGPIKFLPSLDCYRPSVWLTLPGWYLVVFFGWQRPSILWVPR